jgi:serine phosphatase RsbU (regulator of sigma subunit)
VPVLPHEEYLPLRVDRHHCRRAGVRHDLEARPPPSRELDLLDPQAHDPPLEDRFAAHPPRLPPTFRSFRHAGILPLARTVDCRSVRAPAPQELPFLDAVEAVRRQFEAINYRRARWLWGVLLLIALAALVSGMSGGATLRAAGGGVSLAALLALLPMRRRERFQRNFSPLLFALLSLHALLWMLLAAEAGLAVALAICFVAPALLLLRLRGVEQATVAGLTVGTAYLRMALPITSVEPQDEMGLGQVIAIAIVVVVAAALGSSITSRSRQELLRAWRQASTRERERLRMREELHDARAIQLAMLPGAPPSVPGLDVAGVCVPATEVGGDYYDFFRSDSGALAIAIGDVAGHGVASGLVVASVRAGLHLLADELHADPARVLARLNRIVGGPGGQRLLMTLGLASFDAARGSAAWVAAGHPPPIRWSATTGEVEIPTTGHPPLGTRLPVRLETVERPLAPGDVWLLVSDGALEARDQRGRELGDTTLARVFARRAADGGDASALLDDLLAELARFRGDHPQEDDLTLVVVRATAAE